MDDYGNKLIAKAFDEIGDDYFKIKQDAEEALKKITNEIDEVKAIYEKKRREAKAERDLKLKDLVPKQRNCRYIINFLNRVKKGKMRSRKKDEKNNNNDQSRIGKTTL